MDDAPGSPIGQRAVFLSAVCSHCGCDTRHKLAEGQQNPLRMRSYVCTGCGKKTVQCARFSQCRGAAKSTALWDNPLCSQCLESIGKTVPGTQGKWLPQALETLSPERAAEFLKVQGAGLATRLEEFSSPFSSPRPEGHPGGGGVPGGGAHAPADPGGQRAEGEGGASGGHEDWEVVRDAVLSWEGPEKQAIGAWRPLICRRAYIIRWINSCKGDADRAARRLVAHMQWRKEYELHAIHQEDWSVHDARGEVYVSGVDRAGRASMTWRLGRHVPKNHTPQVAVRFLVLNMERTWAVAPLADHMTVIIDCEGLKLSCYDHAIVSHAIEILSENYPDNLQVVVVFPVNWVLSSLLQVFTPLLSKDTVAKGKLLQKHEIEEGLRSVFEPDQIEQRLGGGLDISTAAHRRIEQESPEVGRSIAMEKVQAGKRVVANGQVLAMQRRLGMQGLEEAGGGPQDDGEGLGGDCVEGAIGGRRARRKLSLGRDSEERAGRQTRGGGLVSKATDALKESGSLMLRSVALVLDSPLRTLGSMASAILRNDGSGWPWGVLVVAIGAAGFATILLRQEPRLNAPVPSLAEQAEIYS